MKTVKDEFLALRDLYYSAATDFKGTALQFAQIRKAFHQTFAALVREHRLSEFFLQATERLHACDNRGGNRVNVNHLNWVYLKDMLRQFPDEMDEYEALKWLGMEDETQEVEHDSQARERDVCPY